jgi:hypothetical protein
MLCLGTFVAKPGDCLGIAFEQRWKQVFHG